jgi:hypothetical protein
VVTRSTANLFIEIWDLNQRDDQEWPVLAETQVRITLDDTINISLQKDGDSYVITLVSATNGQS